MPDRAPSTSTPAALSALAAGTLNVAADATAAGPSVCVRIARRTLRMSFDGPASAGALTPAWRPFVVDPTDDTDAQLFVVTADRSGAPPAVLHAQEPGTAGALATHDLEPTLLAGAGTLTVWDPASRRGLWWTRSPESITVADRILPLRRLLREVLVSLDVHVVRGAVVGSTRGGVLIACARGGGATTTALACRRLGLATLADEYVALDVGDLLAFPVSSLAKLTDRSLTLLPELIGRLAPLPRTSDGKQALLLDQRPLRMTDGMPLRAIVIPQLGAATGMPAPATREVALEALLGGPLQTLPPGSLADAQVATSLVERLPAFTLPVGPTPRAIATAVASLLREDEHDDPERVDAATA